MTAGTAAHAASEEPQVMVIMDSSGSMKRRIGPRSKMEVAKLAVADFVKDVDPQTPIGLMVYGARRAKDCTDIQVAIPPNAGQGDKIASYVDGLRPRGETPIAQSLKDAAEYMGHRSRTATVVLVTDGEEACNADPCQAAAELEESGVEFTAHVVGFGLNEEQSLAVRCLADNTGGQFIAADDAASLAAALVKTVATPEPAPIVKASTDNTIWFDDFDGESLGEQWSIRNEDTDSYIVDGGQLIMINAQSHRGPSKANSPNFFDATIDLPSGDWDLSVHGTFEFSTGRDAFLVGLTDDEGRGIYAGASNHSNSNGPNFYVFTHEYKGFAKRTGEATLLYAPPKGENKTLSVASKNFASRPTTLTLHKRGRKYYTSIDNGPAGEEGQTETLTVLRAPKRLTLMVQKYGNYTGDTVVSLDWVKLTAK
ncbi:MAG: VWA domain-containing protein [Pseudomonadota bacterium]